MSIQRNMLPPSSEFPQLRRQNLTFNHCENLESHVTSSFLQIQYQKSLPIWLFDKKKICGFTPWTEIVILIEMRFPWWSVLTAVYCSNGSMETIKCVIHIHNCTHTTQAQNTHCCHHKSLLLPIISQSNLFYILTTYFFKSHLNIITLYTSNSNWYLSSFSIKILYAFLQCVLQVLSIYSSLI
jgi:hypothetical protein